MLTGDQPIQKQVMDPAVKALIERIKEFSPEDLKDWFDLVQQLHETDDQEEYESLIRAIEEIWEQKPVTVSSFPLTVQPLSPGLKKWAEHVGCKIRELRKNARMKQADLAKAAGLTQSEISRLENAENIATHLTLAKIARALSVDVGVIDPGAD